VLGGYGYIDLIRKDLAEVLNAILVRMSRGSGVPKKWTNHPVLHQAGVIEEIPSDKPWRGPRFHPVISR